MCMIQVGLLPYVESKPKIQANRGGDIFFIEPMEPKYRPILGVLFPGRKAEIEASAMTRASGWQVLSLRLRPVVTQSPLVRPEKTAIWKQTLMGSETKTHSKDQTWHLFRLMALLVRLKTLLSAPNKRHKQATRTNPPPKYWNQLRWPAAIR